MQKWWTQRHKTVFEGFANIFVKTLNIEYEYNYKQYIFHEKIHFSLLKSDILLLNVPKIAQLMG